MNPLDRKKKQNDIVSVNELFDNNRVFRVPDYQRGYAWSKEFRVLWQDIIRIHKTASSKHYTGMLAIEEITDNNVLSNEFVPDTSAFYIVDGQQRITSLVIIIKALLTYVKDELSDKDLSSYDNLLSFDGINRFGYSSLRNDGSDTYFAERIYNNNTSLPCADRYLFNINSAKEYIDGELNKIDGEDALEILETILNRIVFNIYFVTPDFDVRVTFETINNRGKRLSNLELLKNRLMFLSNYFNSKTKKALLKKDINNTWKEIYTKLCVGDEQLSDDEFLKAHWFAYDKLKKANSQTYIDDLLQKKFSADGGEFQKLILGKDEDAAYDLINNYIKSLWKYVSFWALINKPDKVQMNIDTDEFCLIKRLSRINNAFYLRCALMILAAETECNIADKKKLYNKIELFVFVNKLLAQDRNDLSFLVTSLKKLMSASSSDKSSVLNEIINSKELMLDASRIKNSIAAFKINVLEKKSDYFYSWNGLSYFLYEYNESLNYPSAAPVEWYKLGNTSIEHVLPQTPEKEYWKEVCKDYSPDEIKIITNSLGNLLLLSSGSENSSLQNFSFPVKKDIDVGAKKFAYCNGSRSAREIAKNDNWTINEINERNNKLIVFMFSRWFDGIIPRSEWDTECSPVLNNNLPKAISDSEYNKLCTTLNNIDTSKERNSVIISTVKRSPVEHLKDQFITYIDSKTINLSFNSKKIYHTENSFSCVIDVDSSNKEKPVRLRCGVIIKGVNYTLLYNYTLNEIKLIQFESSGEKLINEDEIKQLPDKLQYFIRSLRRYLRKARSVYDAPKWITE